ncbi:hypothetical protein ACHAPJ_006926 [Fusarium lateritium]
MASESVTVVAQPKSCTVLEFLVWLCWAMLSLTPNCMMNPVFDQIFPDPEVTEAKLYASPLRFVDGLLDVLQSQAAPSLSFFKGLPSDFSSRWGIYVLVLEKTDYRPRIYIGSGTAVKGGVMKRIGQYRRRETEPFYVSQALNEGFTVTHCGLLCWSPIPDLTRVASLRGLYLLLEAAFTLWFWPIVSQTKDYGMPRLSPWSDAREYDGCCNHFSLTEGAHGIESDLTPEQADVIKAVRRRKAREFTDSQPIAYRRARNNKSSKKRREAVLASKKYFCDACQLVFDTPSRKKRHEARKAHLDKVAGITRVGDPLKAERHRKNIATKRYYCRFCDYAAGDQSTLNDHLTSKRHLQKAAESSSQLG